VQTVSPPTLTEGQARKIMPREPCSHERSAALFSLEGDIVAEAVGTPHPFSKVFESQGNFFQKVSLQVQGRALQKTP